MQGQISEKGHLQGFVNPTGNLQGTMSTESLIDGQVVGMRGLKGDKGDKGDIGEQGERGYGITSIVYNADKTITITYADGETVTTDVLQGEKGDIGDKGDKGDTGSTGATGNGIASAVLNADYTLTLTFTDGTTYTTPSIRGQKGDAGDTGQQGEQGVQGETGNGISSIIKTATVGKVDTYTITFTDGTTTTFDVKNGEDGTGTGDMLKSVYDTNDNGKVDEAESVAWSGVTGKPEDYPPSSHTHDDRYYTEGEVDTALSNKVGLTDYATGSDAGVVKTTSTYGVQTNASGYLYGLNIPSAQYGSTSINAVVSKGTLDNLISSGHIAQESDIPTKTSELTNDSGFLTQHQSLSAYRTSSAQDTIDAGKSDVGHTHTKSNITDFAHNHDDRYYTEAEVDTALSGKSNTGHTHDDRYYTEAEVDEKLVDAGKVTDVQLDGVSVVVSKVANLVGLAKQTAINGILDLIPSGTTNVNHLTNKSYVDDAIPTELADLSSDATHRLVTDTEKTLWNSKTKVTINRWESDD